MMNVKNIGQKSIKRNSSKIALCPIIRGCSISPTDDVKQSIIREFSEENESRVC